MDGSIRLSDSHRKTALSIYRSGGEARVARRAHVLLLLDRDWSYREIMEALLCGSDFVAAVKRRFLEAGFDAALVEGDDDGPIPYWKIALVGWVQHKTPRDFGYFRSRWTGELLAEVLWEEHAVRIGGEAVRRALHQLGFAWRRPRPVVGPTDPEYSAKLRRIQRLLRTLPVYEVAVFQDEVDVHLNPKIGCAWMPVGQQATVETPGNNVKRHVAGSLFTVKNDWRLPGDKCRPSRSAGLIAESDLANRREILDVDARGQVGLVPVNLGQDGLGSEGMKCRHFAAREWGVAGVLAGAPQKSLAVADDVADLNSL
jgi:transposase